MPESFQNIFNGEDTRADGSLRSRARLLLLDSLEGSVTERRRREAVKSRRTWVCVCRLATVRSTSQGFRNVVESVAIDKPCNLQTPPFEQPVGFL